MLFISILLVIICYLSSEFTFNMGKLNAEQTDTFLQFTSLIEREIQ
ncbi:hypothetical protein LM900558_140028 [Listeria monocytogenes]|nr:hypothetical protein LM500190_110030 [Listeria monocytogenes]CUL70535.1 hypothetical protein LM801408_190002 [Listeria monocytogenes]SCU57611.1 hypothetical protein LM900558_140028 [Listeria monocytogenes]